MPANDYKFVTTWEVRASVEQVSEILEDPFGLVRWWPEVYLSVCEPEPGVLELHTKGWLPYRLRWFSRRTESRHPYGFSLAAWGDLEGEGVWTFTPAGDRTHIRYEWTVRARKPLLRILSPVLRPIFAANHRWAMKRGEEGLKAELARRATGA
ncbi:MAG: SRPBCC family protein [Acidobacteriaceae bacterium]|nr:SRPBCC family protein [Acidobacteriaceae bacterium]